MLLFPIEVSLPFSLSVKAIKKKCTRVRVKKMSHQVGLGLLSTYHVLGYVNSSLELSFPHQHSAGYTAHFTG